MRKLPFIIYQYRIALFFCLTVVGLTYLGWQFAVLDGDNSKAITDPMKQGEIDHNIFSDIQDILLNSSGYDDIFIRDLDVSCLYPMKDPLDKRAMRYYEKKSIRCIDPNDDRAVINHMYGLGVKSEMLRENEYCFYSEITRPLLEDKAVFSLKAPLVGTVYPQSDFNYIECTDEDGNVVFTDYLAHLQRLPAIKAYKNRDEYSVAVIGIGFMSRLNFMRQMPRSYNYMKNRLGSIEMLGFTIAESVTTYLNIMEMFRGNESFVFSKFIWDHFSEAGAVTLYGEDVPNTDMFVMRGLPMKRQPTHHYGNIFWAAIKNSQKAGRSQKNCFGKSPNHSLHLNYLLSFIRTYQNSPSFLFSVYNELTRSNINMAQGMDDDFVKFLKTMGREDLLRRTVLMIVGVHGHRVLGATQGWIEDAMPLVSIILPQSAPQLWKQAVQVNRKRLTSTHDLYQTFVDILETLTVSKAKVGLLRKMNAGSSLFSEISPYRTCKDASVVDGWCLCQEATATSSDVNVSRTINGQP